MRFLRAPLPFAISAFILFASACAKPSGSAQGADAAGPPVPTPSPANTSAAPAADCTLGTPLLPGIPGSPGHLIPSSRNPNGDSELSAHMRMMESSLRDSRDAVSHGQKVGPFAARFAKIRCAWPTTPGDRNEQFDAQARTYLLAVGELDHATPDKLRPAFDHVLDTCRACHENSCSGAIVAIEALRLKDK